LWVFSGKIHPSCPALERTSWTVDFDIFNSLAISRSVLPEHFSVLMRSSRLRPDSSLVGLPPPGSLRLRSDSSLAFSRLVKFSLRVTLLHRTASSMKRCGLVQLSERKGFSNDCTVTGSNRRLKSPVVTDISIIVNWIRHSWSLTFKNISGFGQSHVRHLENHRS